MNLLLVKIETFSKPKKKKKLSWIYVILSIIAYYKI